MSPKPTIDLRPMPIALGAAGVPWAPLGTVAQLSGATPHGALAARAHAYLVELGEEAGAGRQALPRKPAKPERTPYWGKVVSP